MTLHSPSDLQLAEDSYRSILKFLGRLQELPNWKSVYLGGGNELNLDKVLINSDLEDLHKNLSLIFDISGKHGSGAKFSLREDGRFTITIYGDRSNIKNIYEWFLNRRSSYIHEFTHYLEYRDRQDIENIDPPNPKDDIMYYNHPSELKAYTAQGISDIMHVVRTRLLEKTRLFEKEFGRSLEEFIHTSLTKYFDRDFIKNIAPDNRTLLINQLKKVYNDLIGTILITEIVKHELLKAQRIRTNI